MAVLFLLRAPLAAAPLGSGFTYQGQLQDGTVPTTATSCDFQFSLWDAAGSGAPPSGGAQVGATQTLSGVSVSNGVFAVQLNDGGEFGAGAFTGSERWLQVAVRCPAGSGSFSAPFAPRQALTAAPYALYAAQVAPTPTPGARFTDNFDGTVTDHTTALMWEKKTGTVGEEAVDCSFTRCSDPRNVNNTYQWCQDLNRDATCDNNGPYANHPPDGGAFFDFLARTNGILCSTDTCTGLGGHTDWRLPTLAELKTIRLSTCPFGDMPCIDPIFGPTVPFGYWSSATREAGGFFAWLVYFYDGTAYSSGKPYSAYVRAVRGGL